MYRDLQREVPTVETATYLQIPRKTTLWGPRFIKYDQMGGVHPKKDKHSRKATFASYTTSGHLQPPLLNRPAEKKGIPRQKKLEIKKNNLGPKRGS